MLKRHIALILCICMALLLTACDPAEDPADIGASPTPNYAEGFSEAGAVFSGGVAEQEGVNLREYSVEYAEDVSTVTLSFVQGSKVAGDADESEVAALPQYRVYLTDAPTRLAVELTGVTYWDYGYNTSTDADSCVLQTFRSTVSDSAVSTLYMQLSAQCVFDVAADGGNIVIRLLAKSLDAEVPVATDSVEQLDTSRYYCMGNTYRSYLNGVISSDEALTPTLTNNLNTIVMISEPFGTMAEAEAFRNELMTRYDTLANAYWEVITLDDAELPELSSTYEFQVAASYKAARIEGIEVALELSLANGVYMCVNPNNDGIVYARFSDIEGSSQSAEELWTKDAQGNESRMLRQQFYSIESVSYSPNGNYFIVLERTLSGSALYLYDGYTNELISDLSRAGFGNMVSSVIWDFFGTKLYAIGGSTELGIHQYDLSVRAALNRHSVVYQKSFDDSGLCYLDGELLFVRSSQEEGAYIYSIMPDGGSQKRMLKGSSFALSPDSRYLAYIDTGDYLYEDTNTTVYIMDTATGDVTEFDPGFPVYSLAWTCDSSRLLYFENRISSDSEDGQDDPDGETEALDAYPYTLYSYTIASREIKRHADLSTMYITASPTNPTAIYVMHYALDEFDINATYILNLR
ncbi:MAG: WD40 repeat domain-containing protein [Clostridia bacterium]|nr:WD40 repeat domain-containing protein [Clostridia bacterium]